MEAGVPPKGMSVTNPIRPLSLEYKDAETEVFAAINQAIVTHRIPLVLMESIVTKALYQLKEGARAEIANVSSTYQQQLDACGKSGE